MHSTKDMTQTAMHYGNPYREEGRVSGNRTEGLKHSIHSSKMGPMQKMTTPTPSTSLPKSICSSYTQILLNPMQLQDHEFMAWLDRLVEAKKNRQEKKSCLYCSYREPYNEKKQSSDSRWHKPQLRHKMKPTQELDVQQIMDTYQCQYNDVVEAVDMYNLDVEECQSA